MGIHDNIRADYIAGRYDVYPENVPQATPKQAAEAMRDSVERAALPPALLDLIRDPRLSIPGDPLAPRETQLDRKENT